MIFNQYSFKFSSFNLFAVTWGGNIFFQVVENVQNSLGYCLIIFYKIIMMIVHTFTTKRSQLLQKFYPMASFFLPLRWSIYALNNIHKNKSWHIHEALTVNFLYMLKKKIVDIIFIAQRVWTCPVAMIFISHVNFCLIILSEVAAFMHPMSRW